MSDPRPLVSICISAYNADRFLGEALRSVLAQTYRNLEIIVLDNGSADGTFGVAQSFEDPRLRTLRVEDNLGAYQAMNRLAAMASGELVAIYHADDVYEPTIVEHEVAHLTEHPDVAAVFCTDTLIDENGRVFGRVNLLPAFADKPSLSYAEVVRYLVRRKNTLFCCPTFMVRRPVFGKLGGFHPETYGILSDLEMWLRIVREYPVAILDERLIRYRKGRHQWSARYRHERTEAEGFFAVLDEYLAKDDWLGRLSPGDLIEYQFHRVDDATFRAANLVQQGDVARASALLDAHPFPWRTLLVGPRRRKLRNIVLRGMIRAGIAVRATGPLGSVLRHIGP